jgi:hypothetical protein
VDIGDGRTGAQSSTHTSISLSQSKRCYSRNIGGKGVWFGRCEMDMGEVTGCLFLWDDYKAERLVVSDNC